MVYFKTKVQKSTIEGKGLFAQENIPKKSVVFIFPVFKYFKTLPEKEFDKSWLKKNPAKKDLIIRKSGVRYIRDIFLYYSKNEKKTQYVNHSDNPNILYHCGIGFAKKNIKKGEELTVDYRYFDTKNSDNFINRETGKKLKKYNSDAVLKKSAEELLDVFKK